jgi:hypothetical protein
MSALCAITEGIRENSLSFAIGKIVAANSKKQNKA